MSDAGWMNRVETVLGLLAARYHRRPVRALLLAAGLTGLGAYLARDLTLDADFVTLLPESFESVQDLDQLRQRFGGMGFVVVTGMNAEREQLVRFVEDMVPKLEELEEVRFVDYRHEFDFFEARALYYLDVPDIEAVRERLQARIDWERQARNPLFIRLDDEPAPDLDFADIEDRYAGNTNRRLAGTGEVYYYSADKRMIVALCKPRAPSTDMAYSRRVVDQVRDLIRRQDLSQYGPEFTWSIGGQYVKKVDQQIEITSDLARASLIAAILLVLYLAFHFRGPLGVLFTLVPVFAAMTWVYGFVGVAFGTVNLLTAFGGAILGGLGAEHGIHLLGRYMVLRNAGRSSEDATRETFSHTGSSALISAFVAALTFASLSGSEFGAFKEFGVIAGVGMLVGVLAYVIILPPLLGLATRLGWKPMSRQLFAAPDSEVAHLLARHSRGIAVGTAIILALLIWRMPSVSFDYDFRSLDDLDIPSVALDRDIDSILGYSQTPVVVLTDDTAMEVRVAAQLKSRQEAKGEKSTIDFIAALDDLVPKDQEKKQAVIREIGSLLTDIDPQKLDDGARQSYDRALRMTRAEPFGRSDIPISIRRQFEGLSGEKGGFVLVFSRVSLADGAEVRRFAKDVRGIDVGAGHRVSASGEAMILADILEMIGREAPRILALAALSVLLAMWLTMGSLRFALYCMTPTVLSILALGGVMSIMDMRFNYLNIVVIPVLIGTTVDAGVHLVSRLSERGDAPFTEVYGETGRAIVGGLITSAVGFAAMIIASHPGLNSIGELANLGYAVNLAIILVGFPALLLHVKHQRARRRTAKAGGSRTEERA